jgi:hypothetical protein
MTAMMRMTYSDKQYTQFFDVKRHAYNEKVSTGQAVPDSACGTKSCQRQGQALHHLRVLNALPSF